jgi:hypothetical protein
VKGSRRTLKELLLEGIRRRDPDTAAGMTLVTRNVADVERTGVACLDPFA